MTTVYFIRHAQSDTSVSDPRTRPLTPKGLESRAAVNEFLQGKNVDAVLSSPLKRAYDTVADFAENHGFAIQVVEDFREQRSSSDMRRSHPDFYTCLRRQWEDFTYAFSDGECLLDVQTRNIAALNSVLAEYSGKKIVIGTHGTALSTIINYYDNAFGYENFREIEYKLPWAVTMVFNGLNCVSIDKIDLHEPEVTIRLAQPDDALDMAEVHMRSWEVAYKDIIPQEYIRQKNATRVALYQRAITHENADSYVIQYDGKTVGIMNIAPSKDDDIGEDTYELHYIYLHPDYFRKGIGTKAMEFAFAYARGLGKTYMIVWVFAENANAIKFYQKFGFAADGCTDTSDYGKIVQSIRMRAKI